MTNTPSPHFFRKKARCLLALLPFYATTPSHAVESSAGSGEIAIYTEATGTDTLTTADFIHDFDTTAREDLGSFTRSGTDITLNRAGHYLAIYNSRFNGAPVAGTEERVEIQSSLTLGGSALPIGWSQGFIRRQQEHVDAITTGMAVIEASANDILQLHSQRTDTTTVGTVTRFPDATGLQLVKLDDTNMAYARLSLGNDQTGPTTATGVKVLYDLTDELDPGFSYASGDLTLVDQGKYLVIANSYVTTAINRIGFVQQLTLDGTPISGTRTTIYTRGSQNTIQGAAAIGTIIETTSANQVLSVLGELDGGTFTSTYKANRCALTVVKLPSAAAGTAPLDPDFLRLSHNANQNVNTTTDLIFDTNIELDAEFTHTAGTSEINVATGGDYLFLGSYYGADDGAARGLSSPGWSINDGPVLNIGQSGRYTRNTGPPEFGNTLGLVASALASGDKVEMVTRALGSAGTNNANPVALQGVRLSSLFTPPAAFEVVILPTAVATTEGGATATYELSLGLAPASGSVTVTISPDSQSVVSSDGTNFFASLDVILSDTTAQTITVQAVDDSDIESAHSSTIAHAITATGDALNYPTTLPIPDAINSIADNDVVPVVATDDASTTNVSEDAIATEAIIAPQPSLLANDTDGFGNVVISSEVESAFGAVVSINPDGTFTYDPTNAPGAQMLAAGTSGIDTFEYTVQDSEGNTSVGTVSVSVDGANDRPHATDDHLNDGPFENASSYLNAIDLTANDGNVRTVTLTFPSGSDLRLLPGKTTTQTPSVGTPPGNGFPENAFDGNLTTFTHTQSANNTVDHVWQVDFGQDVLLENVTLTSRLGTTNVRFRDITVTVLDSLGASVFDSGLLNPTTDPLTVATSLFVDFAGPITGRTLVVTRTPDLNDLDADNGSILSLAEVTVIGSVPGIYSISNGRMLLNYEASQSANTGRWENRGEVGGTPMDWVLTDITLDSNPLSARAGISAAYEWDNAADDATLAAGVSGSINDNVPGDPDAGNATWEFWVKPANTTDIMTLFETGGATGFGCIINQGVLEAATGLDGSSMTGSYVSYDLLADPQGLVGGNPTTEFNQYAVTITINGGLQLYVNGVKVDETIGGVPGDWDGGDGAGLGGFGETNHGGFLNTAAGSAYDAPFLGQMAIVRLYSGVLSGAEILQNFKSVNAGTDIDGDAISVTGVVDGSGIFVPIGSPATLASGAIVTMNNNSGEFDYNPNGAFNLAPNEIVMETFTYRASDGNGEFAQANVNLLITGVVSGNDDNLLASEGENKVFFANAIVGNDEELPTAAAPYINLIPANISGGTWMNTGSAGSGWNGSSLSSVSAPTLESNFGRFGAAAIAGNIPSLDPISAADATFEVWFKPTPGQSAKSTIFETGGNGIGFSIVYDPAAGSVIATIDGGDDITQVVQAIVPGVVTSDFNQVIVTLDLNGGNEVGVGTGVFEDIMTVYLNNDPATPFDAAADATIVDVEGDANDWSGTDGSGINRVSGTTALNENFPGMDGEVAIVRVYQRILTPAEMELNYVAAVHAISSVTSPSTIQGSTVTLNADRSVSVDYSGLSIPSGTSVSDAFTYTVADGVGGISTATALVTIESINTIQENWRLLYYGDVANSGPGADGATAANGLTNLQNFALDLDPTAAAGTLDVDAGNGTITTLGPPAVWVDPADGRIYFRHTRRSDFAAIPLTITDQFSRDLNAFEDSATAPTVIATGTGASGVAIQAVQTEFPLILPVNGGKGRFGRLNVTTP